MGTANAVPPWPPLLALYVHGCEASSSLVQTTRALLRALGAPRVSNWVGEPYNKNQWGWPAECNETAHAHALGVRLNCLHRLAAADASTYVFKVNTALFESPQARFLLDAYRKLAVPVLVYARESALQLLACCVRDCFNTQTGGEKFATLVDAAGRPMPLCRRFNNSYRGMRGPADAVRASVEAGSRVRLVTNDSAAVCARLNALRASRSLGRRSAFLRIHGMDAAPAPASFEQLLLDANASRRAAAWRVWLSHGVPAVAAFPPSRAEAIIAHALPPVRPSACSNVWAHYESPAAVRALAREGGCVDAVAT